MTPEPKINDFFVPIDGIGEFRFARRSLGVEIATKVEYARLSEGVVLEWQVEVFLRHIANLKVMTVEAPASWNMDLDQLDGDDEAVVDRIFKVGEALREKELTFRPAVPKPQGSEGAVSGQGTGGAPGGAGDGEQLSVLVSESLQADGDRPALP